MKESHLSSSIAPSLSLTSMDNETMEWRLRDVIAVGLILDRFEGSRFSALRIRTFLTNTEAQVNYAS